MTYFQAADRGQPVDLACSVSGECVEKALGEGAVLTCVLREPLPKSRAICFGTPMVTGSAS